jgi:signal transduction histidine kinase
MTRSADAQHDAEPHLLPLRPASVRSGSSAIAPVLEAVVIEVAAAREVNGLPPISVVLDVGGSRIQPADLAAVREALGTLLASACDAAATATPRLREVVVTVIDTAAALEIEVADSGPGVPPTAITVARPAVERLGGTLAFRGCPEGGLAVTLRLPHHRLKSRAA